LHVVAKKTSRSPKAPTAAETADVKTAGKPAAPKRAAPKAAVRRKVVAATNGAEETPVAPRVVTDEDIRMRAYFLSMEHRGQGSDIDFWLIAERELRPRSSSRK
jgi:hypothetical protein